MWSKSQRLRDMIENREKGKEYLTKMLNRMADQETKKKKSNIKKAQRKAHPQFKKF